MGNQDIIMVESSLMHRGKSQETPEKKQNEVKLFGKSGLTKKQIKDKID